MKKITLFLSLLFIGTQIVKAQQFFEKNELETKQAQPVKIKVQNSKALGDTLWSEDFDGGLPSCWSIANNSSNSFSWQWDTVYRSGMFTTGISALNSTTASNGFMLLPLDFFNTPISGTPVAGDTYFQSCAIPIPPKPNVELKLQQYYSFCCGTPNSKAVIQISTDSFATFTEYDLNGSNTSTNVENLTINVSSVLANSSVAYIRVYLEGFPEFFWMLDDIALVEGPGQEISEVGLTSGIPYIYDPFMTIQPLLHARNIGFEANVQNVTGSTISGTTLGIIINHISAPSGSGAGTVYNNTFPVNGNGVLTSFETDTMMINSPAFFPSQKGDYEVDFTAYSTQYPVADTAFYKFSIGDTVFGRDNNFVGGYTGPSNYVDQNSTPGGTADGDRMGLLYNIDSVPGVGIMFSSVSMYISSQMANAGAVIRPVVWEYDETNLNLSNPSSAFGREVASSLQTFTITAGQLDSWQTFMLDTGLIFSQQNNFGQFVVGWEMVGGTSNGSRFTVGNDISVLVNPTNLSCFLSFGHDPMKNWGWANALPMIRLNASNLLVGLKEDVQFSNAFSVHPNPSNGVFNFSMKKEIVRLKIFDVNGKVIMDRGNFIEREIDLSDESKGIYFIKIEAQSGEVYSKKLMLN